MSVATYSEHGIEYYLDTIDAPDGAKIRHAATSTRPSPFPGFWEMLWEAAVLLCFQLRAGYRITAVWLLEQVEPLRLRFWFVIHWAHYIAPAKVGRTATSVAKAVRNEELHKTARSAVITMVYIVAGAIAVASAPKILILVWSI